MTGPAALALVLCLATPMPSWAQAPQNAGRSVSHEISATLMGLPYSVGAIAVLIVGAQKCRPDKEAQWRRVIDAIDRRYQHCAGMEPRWQADVSRQFAKEEEQARAAGSSTGVGSLAGAFFWSSAARPLEEKGAAACAHVGVLLDPTSDEARAAYLRSVPQATPESLNMALSRTRELLALADNTVWVESPCNTFWPNPEGKK